MEAEGAMYSVDHILPPHSDSLHTYRGWTQPRSTSLRSGFMVGLPVCESEKQGQGQRERATASQRESATECDRDTETQRHRDTDRDRDRDRVRVRDRDRDRDRETKMNRETERQPKTETEGPLCCSQGPESLLTSSMCACMRAHVYVCVSVCVRVPQHTCMG